MGEGECFVCERMAVYLSVSLRWSQQKGKDLMLDIHKHTNTTHALTYTYIWTHDTIYTTGSIFVHTAEGNLTAFDNQSGKQAWTVAIPGAGGSTPVVSVYLRMYRCALCIHIHVYSV